jgi:AraC-like DNA-binding protein
MNGRLPATDDLRLIVKENGYCVAKLALSIGLHVRTLERRFSDELHATPKVWIWQERIKLAVPLLTEGFSNKEVAASLGYSCVSNFCRDFKRHFGRAPQAFGLENRNRVPLR